MPTNEAVKKTTTKKTTVKKTAEPAATTATTVADTQVEPANRPDSFKALKLRDLQFAADAFGADWEDLNEDAIRANLEEEGVTWKMYARQFKLPGWENLPDDDEAEPTFVEDWDEAEEVEETVSTVITRSPMQDLEEGKYLIKFVGENWYFERGKYKFSPERPYALMSAKEAQSALVDEPTKFRQAMPQELEEYYN